MLLKMTLLWTVNYFHLVPLLLVFYKPAVGSFHDQTFLSNKHANGVEHITKLLGILYFRNSIITK